MAKDLTDFSIAAILELSDEDIPSFKDTHLLDDQERLQRTLTEFAKERQIEDCGSPDKKKKTRTVFTRQQIQRLENAFDRKKYFTNSERQKLASELCLSETQVKIWLQNRRNKWKKQICTDGHHSNIPYHSLIPDISRDVAPTDRHYPLLNRRDFRGYDERPKLFS